METVKRHAEVGERIVITEANETETKCKNGDVFTTDFVNDDGTDWFYTKFGKHYMYPEEYEFLVE